MRRLELDRYPVCSVTICGVFEQRCAHASRHDSPYSACLRDVFSCPCVTNNGRCNSFGQEPVCSFRQRYSEGSMWSAIQVRNERTFI